LSHAETCVGENGQDIAVHEGMAVTRRGCGRRGKAG
jgi:hypothetical protein